MDALVQPDPNIENISLLPANSLIEKYSNDHRTLLKITEKALCTCLEDHQPTCPPYRFGSNEFLPTRLIDLKNLECLRLIVTAETTIQDRRYVPLSHRWGTLGSAEREAMTTTSANLARRLEGFGLSTLPARYIEAILICRTMGVRYIWIDSLCIIQGSSEDWHSQCAQMGEVYEGGVFTIASNLSDDDQPWLPPDPLPWALKLWKGGPHKAWLSELITNSPLASRGWCLQERHLSPRILHVYHKQVWVWECNFRVRGTNSSGLVYSSDVTDDTLSWRKQTLTRSTSLSRDQLFDCWHKMVADYTKRRLTNRSDRLPAISGVERRLQPLLSCAYHAGTWESDIFGLLWYSGTVLQTGEARSNRMSVSHEFLVENLIKDPSDTPTWTWAASNKPVRFMGLKISGVEQGWLEPITENRWSISRSNFTCLAGIIYHSTISDQKIHNSSSITLIAPEWPSDAFHPTWFSLDNFLVPESEYDQHRQLSDIYQLKQNPRDEATQLHFVILGRETKSKTRVPDEYAYGIILAPSRLHTGAFVRLGIWTGWMAFHQNLDIKFEFTIV